MKRPFDLVVALLGLLLLSPLMAAVAIAIKLESRGSVFYRGQRVGKDGRPFRIYKFRTMTAGGGDSRIAPTGGITYHGDPRVTRLGAFLRRHKIDEILQLINVVKGEMSLVGPRPEDPRYVAMYSPRERLVLSVRPGITSIASIRYRNEEQLLPPGDWEKVYTTSILPAKLDLELNYLKSRSRGQDLLILLATLFALLNDEAHFESWANAIRRLEQLLERYGSWLVVDIPLIIAAYALAIVVRSINTALDFPAAFLTALLGVSVYIAANYAFGIYRRFWRYASAQEAVSLLASTATATLLLMFADSLLQERALPLGAVALGGFFTAIFLAAARYRRNLVQGAFQLFGGLTSLASGRGARVLIVGAGDEGQLLAWQLRNRLQGRTYQVVGFVDDNREKHGVYIHNVRVYGDRQRIPELVTSLHADLIIIAIPPLNVAEPRELLALCRSTSAQIKILPGLFDWLDHSAIPAKGTFAPGWEDVGEGELLERVPYQVDEKACRELLADRVVLVTGAAGSIGRELCRQIAAHRPRRLVALDTNESGLHDLAVELHTRSRELQVDCALCDITVPSRLRAVFDQSRPQVVFHAAAYKHVPMLEAHPAEGIRANVLGTQLVHAVAQASGVQRFILISSDKAVNPTSVLGMTKWLGELLVTGTPNGEPMLSTAVRFGNVLGSRGSVVPTFERQIELGGPITITHPDMTRYFLSVGEAVSLVIQAAAMTRGSDIYILDMGVPMKITELAHRMIRLHGLRPGQDIALEYVGLRPGEKLSEELVADGEQRHETHHPSIFRIDRCRPVDAERLARQVDRLVADSDNGMMAEALRAELRRTVEMMQIGTMPS